MPPEAFSCDVDDSEDGGYKADIYAAGIVLFNLLTGCMPYAKATPDNDLYIMFEKDREAFWEHHQRYSFEDKISEPLKELLTGMLEPWPGRRWSISKTKACAWYSGECATHKRVAKEMRRRSSCVDLAKSFPEKRVEITKSCTARSKKRTKHGRRPNKFLAASSLNYEGMGMAMWKLCTALFGA